MRFMVKKKEKTVCEGHGDFFPQIKYYVIQVEPQLPMYRTRIIAEFTDDIRDDNYGLAELLAGDYCEFLNSKYLDKNFNEEWGKVDVEARIKYHEEQIKILKSGEYYWDDHGVGVE